MYVTCKDGLVCIENSIKDKKDNKENIKKENKELSEIIDDMTVKLLDEWIKRVADKNEISYEKAVDIVIEAIKKSMTK